MQAVKSLGILGGTFDPIHYGHLTAAECARYEFHLDKVLFIPSARPPHKDRDLVSDCTHRYTMLSKAIADNPVFAISPLEIQREGLSYTVDTVEYFLRKYPETKIYFILGIDALLLMDTWKEAERLAGLCEFIAVSRPGYQINSNDPQLKKLPAALWDNLHIMEIPGNTVSSSDLRKRVFNGKPIKYLLPPAVEEYIYAQGLYINKESKT
ncbi:MAG: nicotinate-nucleotide adenylyltransferase [Syntrophomonadaceae bacterium]